MSRKQLLESALVFAMAAAALAWLAYRFEASLLDGLMPLFHAELHALMPEFRIEYLDWKIDRNETVVAFTAMLTENRVLLGRVLPPGVTISAATLATHAWVHPVLMLSLLAAWPGIPWKRKPLLLMLGLFFVLVAETLDIPLMLWGSVEDVLYWQIDPVRVAESLGSRVQHFLDGGGRYALSIFLSLLAINIFKRISVMNSRGQTPT